MALVIMLRTFISVMLVIRSLVAVEITSIEEGNVTLGWNIDSKNLKHLMNIKHPSGKVIFFLLGTNPYDNKNSEYSGRWEFIGNRTSGNIHFMFMDIRESDAGNYSIELGNTRMENDVTLVVYLKPGNPTITVVKEPVITSTMVVTCCSQSTSVPSGHRSLKMMYEWYIDSRKIMNGGRYQSKGNQLSVPNITKKDEGLEIMCAAEETTKLPSDNSSAYRIVVEYGPGLVTLSPSKVSYTLLEITDTLGPVYCSSDCNPECTYHWRHGGTDVTTGSVLLVTNVTRKQSGTYHCKASNKHNTRGRVSPTISVVVEYAPINTKLITSADHNVNETTTVSFKCTTESVPSSTIQLMYQGEETISIKSEKDTVNSTFRILRTNCLDTGKYICSATNKVGSSDSDKINLNVFCSPRPDDRVKVIKRYLLENGDDMDITGTFIANPEPTIVWYFQSMVSNDSTELQNNTDNFQFFVDFNHVTYTSRALRTNMEAANFGQYVMMVANDFGKDKLTIYIETRQTSQPEIYYIIFAATGGISVLLTLVIMVIVQALGKRRIGEKGGKTQGTESSAENEEEDVCDDGMKPNIIYESAGPDFQQQCQSYINVTASSGDRGEREREMLYSVQQQCQSYINVTASSGDRGEREREMLYSVAMKYHKQKIEPGIDANAKERPTGKPGKDNVYSNEECADGISFVSNEEVYSNSVTEKTLTDIRKKNKDDLLYIDIEINGTGREGEGIIHGIDNRSNYAEIDLPKHDDPRLCDDLDENWYTLSE